MTTRPLSHPQRSLANRLLALAAATVLLGSLAACSAPSGATSEQSGDPDAWGLQYASCMRDQGIDLPDSYAPKGGVSSLSQGVDHDAWGLADSTCRDKLGAPPQPESEKRDPADYLEQELKAVQCLRDQGFDVDDPKPDGGIGWEIDIPEDVVKKCLADFETVG